MTQEISGIDFQNLVNSLLSVDNDIRNQAEEHYANVNIALKTRFLFEIIASADGTAEAKQLAAVLLRRVFFTSFDDLVKCMTPEQLEQIKEQIIFLTKSISDVTLKKKVCDVAAELARKLIDDSGNNLWPQFLSLLSDCISSSDATLKECALTMFSSVPGVFGNSQNTYLDYIKQMLLTSLLDANLQVEVSAVKATSSFILVNDSEKIIMRHFSECVLPMIDIIQKSMSSDGEEADTVLKAFVDLAEKCSQFLRCQFDKLIQLCLTILSNDAIVESHRHLALEIIISMSENAPSTVRKRGAQYIGQIVTQLLLMMTDVEDDDEWFLSDVNEEDDFDSNAVIGETSLDRLACSVGGRTVLPLVINDISQMLQNQNWKHRYAAMMAVSAVGEGCHKQMLPLLNQIVEGILPYLNDSHPRVRYAACNALGQMATDFAPHFEENYHRKVIPGLLISLDDHNNPRVQAHAGAALVNFFEECSSKTAAIYLDAVTLKIEEILNIKMKELMEKGTKLVLEQVVVTLASLADSAQENFQKYYDKFMPCLKYIIQNATTNELKPLRGKAIECVSLIGLAVGKEKFCSDASAVMDMLLRTQTGQEELADDDPQLSYMITAWARICKILGPQFEPYLPYVMAPVLRAASLKIEVALFDDDDKAAVENDNDWQCLTIGDQQTFGIRTAGLEDKATACQMLVCYARELKHSFSNYVEDTVKIMVPLLKFYFHDGVRTAAAESLPFLIECGQIRGANYVKEMWIYIFPDLLKAVETEPEKEVTAELMTALGTCIEKVGTEIMTGDQIDALIKVLDIHLKDHFSRGQQRIEKRKDEDYDEGVEEALVDEDEEDVYVLSKVTDILHSCFIVFKDAFLPYFDAIVGHFVALAAAERSWTEHQWAICVFDDVIEHCGPKCAKYKNIFLPLLFNGIISPHPEVRQASAFGWGVLAKYGTDAFAKECCESVTHLVNMIQTPDSRTTVNIHATENGISAVSKILQYNSSQINGNEIIPIWLSWLPIWEDEEEIPHVYDFLLSLIEHNHPLIVGENNMNIPRIVAIFAETLARNSMDIKGIVGQKVVSFLKTIQQNAESFAMCMTMLSPQQQEAVKQALIVS